MDTAVTEETVGPGVHTPTRVAAMVDAVVGYLQQQIDQHDHSGCPGYQDGCRCRRDEDYVAAEALLKAEFEGHLAVAEALRADARRPRRRQRIDRGFED